MLRNGVKCLQKTGGIKSMRATRRLLPCFYPEGAGRSPVDGLGGTARCQQEVWIVGTVRSSSCHCARIFGTVRLDGVKPSVLTQFQPTGFSCGCASMIAAN